MLSRKNERRSEYAVDKVLGEGKLITSASNPYARVYYLKRKYVVMGTDSLLSQYKRREVIGVFDTLREAYREAQRQERNAHYFRRPKGPRNYDEYAEPWESRLNRRYEDFKDILGKKPVRDASRRRRRRRRSYR